MTSSEEFTKSKIDRLGDRLRKGDITEADLRLLDTYRRSFAEASEHVFAQIRDGLGLEPTGRPAKSTTSISDKLRRESIRLSQIQDIAGCRVIVRNVLAQDELVGKLKGLFEKVTISDRRERPSHGYRAVHVVVQYSGKLVEVQVRTALQQAWAELSEKLSDLVSPAIKYGGGNPEVLRSLSLASDEISLVERAESLLQETLSMVAPERTLSDDMDRKVLEARELIAARSQRVVKLITLLGEVVPLQEGQDDAVSD